MQEFIIQNLYFDSIQLPDILAIIYSLLLHFFSEVLVGQICVLSLLGYTPWLWKGLPFLPVCPGLRWRENSHQSIQCPNQVPVGGLVEMPRASLMGVAYFTGSTLCL